MSSSEFQEWKSYYLVEPFGNERADLRAGTIAATIANMHRKKGTTAIKPDAFFPKYKIKQTWEDQLRVVEMLNAVFGGDDLRGKPVK